MLTRLYQATGILGRDRGFKLGAGVDSAFDLQQTFSFSNDGRFDTLMTERGGDSGTDRTFDYGYFPDSSLLGSLDSGSFHVTWDYEANRDLLKSINTAWTNQTDPVTRYEYTYNNLNQRIAAVQSGAAFADYGEATFRRFRYNPRGELIQGFDYLGGNIADLSRPLPGRYHEYNYDSAGNRTTANRTGVAGLAEDYATNALNAYTSKENTTLAVSGTAAPGAAVAVAIGSGSAPADRQGAYWSRDMAVGNAGHPWSGAITTYAAAGGSVRADSNRPAQLPALSQTLSYDLDGNLSSDGMWDYGYDAENRLVSMETTLAARSAGIAWRVLRFSYDYAGRRVQKIVLHGADLSFDSGHRYVYDGWNLIAEYDTTGSSLGALRRSYTWGIGTGGAGGLLQIADHAANRTYLPTYDGNGNVAALVNGATGAIAAAYEYSPFGESLRAEVLDDTVADQPFRFSTKFTDTETGLIYYGMRYYSPALGRFINRDPIGEAGGLNLYGFCGNDGVNRSDYLGMTDDSFNGVNLTGFGLFFQPSLPAVDVDDTTWAPANYSVPDAYVNATTGVSRFPSDQPQTKTGAADDASSRDVKTTYERMVATGEIVFVAGEGAATTAAISPRPVDVLNELRKTYGKFIDQPKDGYERLDEALIAATIAVGAKTARYHSEFSSVIYKDENGRYRFTTPSLVGGSSGTGGAMKVDNPKGTVRVAITHGHNVGWQIWVSEYQQRTGHFPGDDFMVNVEANYLKAAGKFSVSDQIASSDLGVPILVFTGDGQIRIYNGGAPIDGRDRPGEPVQGAPSPTEALRIVEAIDAVLKEEGNGL